MLNVFAISPVTTDLIDGLAPGHLRPLAAMAGRFTWIDWLVVFSTLAFATWLGAKKAGKQATIREFFLGGRRLPWWAVCGSIIATEISALTFVSVPWRVFQPGGNLTYLQLGLIGSVLARVIVGYLLVPAYYQREIYSPYDYMGHQLGGPVRSMTTSLFVVGGLLGQAARVYLTAMVLTVVMHDELAMMAGRFGGDPLGWAIGLMTVVAVVWTLMGGMTTVIWTELLLFMAFVTGALTALATVVWHLDGGVGQLIREGFAAKSSGVPWAPWGQPAVECGPWGKFTLFDFSTDPTRQFTIWTAMIAATWGGVGAYGTDQLMAQRMFCCRNLADARKAIILSATSITVTILVAFLGIGLFVYYQHNVPSADALSLLSNRASGDRIFPVFVVEVVPVGLKGLILSAIFAAAISSMMGILTALSQTVMSAFYNPLRERTLRRRGLQPALVANLEHAHESAAGDAEAQRSVRVGRLFVVLCGLALSVCAYCAQYAAAKQPALLDLGQSLAGYAGGGLLAGFALAFLPLKIDGRGYLWSAPLSFLTILSIAWHRDPKVAGFADWTFLACLLGGGVLIGAWFLSVGRDRIGGNRPGVLPFAMQTLLLVAGCAGVVLINLYGHWGAGPLDRFGNPTFKVLAWPWYVPIGSTVAFVWGYFLARRKSEGSEAAMG